MHVGAACSSENDVGKMTAVQAVGLKAWLRPHSEQGALSTNQPSQDLAFQRWYRFKEAFSPQFVVDAVGSLGYKPASCLDPFGGTGTTALTCQFLGVRPTTIEVNPFLADVIEAKLTGYAPSELIDDHIRLLRRVNEIDCNPNTYFTEAPPTLCEPGVNGRWIFDRNILTRILAYRLAIEELDNPNNRRLFRIILGSVLIGASNVVISGKGRRYRGAWRERDRSPLDINYQFSTGFRRVLQDISRFDDRPCKDYLLLRGDNRKLINESEEVDFALFSPPYPNSFDYTDIYNIELWTLGYLNTKMDNTALRNATFRSHVQIKRSFDWQDFGSTRLRKSISALINCRSDLWNPDIPEMIGAYFSDLAHVLARIRLRLSSRGKVLMVVGNSRYANVTIDVAEIVQEIAPMFGFLCETVSPIRVMRASPQQGGATELREDLLRLSRQ